MIRKAKCNHFNQLFLENAKDQKRLFQIADKLLHRKHTSTLPQSQSDEKLANEFSIFFTDKIKKIRDNFEIVDSWRYEDEISPIHQLSSLRSATEDEIYDILSKSPPKSCELDPIPTLLLKKCANALVPIITKIINISMETGVVPDSFKVAHKAIA